MRAGVGFVLGRSGDGGGGGSRATGFFLMGFGFGLTGLGAAGGGRSVSGGPGGGAAAAAFWKALRADASNASRQSWACRAKPACRSASQRPRAAALALPSASRALFPRRLRPGPN